MKFLKKTIKATLSFAEWYKLGMPNRDPIDTSAIFHLYCKGCEYYNPEAKSTPLSPPGLCMDCECHVSPDPNHLLNKVNKATEGCPQKKWHAIVKLPDEQT